MLCPHKFDTERSKHKETKMQYFPGAIGSKGKRRVPKKNGSSVDEHSTEIYIN